MNIEHGLCSADGQEPLSYFFSIYIETKNGQDAGLDVKFAGNPANLQPVFRYLS